MKLFSPIQIGFRGFLYVNALIGAFLYGSAEFKSMVHPAVHLGIGAWSLGNFILRAYIDSSPAIKKNPSEVLASKIEESLLVPLITPGEPGGRRAEDRFPSSLAPQAVVEIAKEPNLQ